MKFEEYLQEEHMKGYIGSKDNASKDFQEWIQELEPEDWIYYGSGYGCHRALKALDKAQEIMTQTRRE